MNLDQARKIIAGAYGGDLQTNLLKAGEETKDLLGD